MTKSTWAFLLLITLAALVTRIAAVDVRPLWLDEGYSHWFASLSLQELWTETPKYDTHPPLYYILLHFMQNAFGTGEPALRALSVLFGVAVVPVVFAMGWLAAPRGRKVFVGLAAALFFAFSPIQFFHSVEARVYAMFAFALTLFATATLTLVNRHYPPELDDQPPRAAWLVYILTGGLSLWLHNTGIVTVGSLGAILALVLVLRTRSLAPLWKVLVAGLAMVAMLLPYLPGVIRQGESVSSSFWIARPSLEQAIAIFFDVFSAMGLPGITIPGLGHGFFIKHLIGIPLLGLAGYGVFRLWRNRRWPTAVMLVAAAFVPFVSVVAISLAIRPILLSRILVGCTAPFLVLVAMGVASLPRKSWRVVIAACIFAVFFGAVANKFFRSFRGLEEWDKVAAFVAEQSRPGDEIWLYMNHLEIVFDYYFEEPERTRPLPSPYPAYGMPNDYSLGFFGSPAISGANLETLKPQFENISRLWLVTRTIPAVNGRVRLNDFVDDHMKLVERWTFGLIILHLYERE